MNMKLKLRTLFKKSAKPETKVISCAYDAGNEHCDLISQLREYQDTKRKIQNEINSLTCDDSQLLSNVAMFMQKAIENGFCPERHSFSDYNMYCFKNTIDHYTLDEVIVMVDSLKTYKNRAEIVDEKQTSLKVIEEKIKDVKSKLGIE